jgi:hypothetical protein
MIGFAIDTVELLSYTDQYMGGTWLVNQSVSQSTSLSVCRLVNQ